MHSLLPPRKVPAWANGKSSRPAPTIKLLATPQTRTAECRDGEITARLTARPDRCCHWLGLRTLLENIDALSLLYLLHVLSSYLSLHNPSMPLPRTHPNPTDACNAVMLLAVFTAALRQSGPRSGAPRHREH